MSKIVSIFLLLLIIQSSVALCDDKGYKIVARDKTEKNEKYSINIRYPEMKESAQSKTRDKFNQMVTKFIEEQKKDFLGELKGENYSIDTAYSFDLTHKIEMESGRLISIVFVGSVYVGGAHPSPIYRTMLYSLEGSQELSLKDLFDPRSDYLAKISRICMGELEKRKISDSDWIKSGASSKKENFGNFYLTQNGLVILFPPYQVACYAVGTQEILIPYEKLSGIIAPQGPIGELIRKP